MVFFQVLLDDFCLPGFAGFKGKQPTGRQHWNVYFYGVLRRKENLLIIGTGLLEKKSVVYCNHTCIWIPTHVYKLASLCQSNKQKKHKSSKHETKENLGLSGFNDKHLLHAWIYRKRLGQRWEMVGNGCVWNVITQQKPAGNTLLAGHQDLVSINLRHTYTFYIYTLNMFECNIKCMS